MKIFGNEFLNANAQFKFGEKYVHEKMMKKNNAKGGERKINADRMDERHFIMAINSSCA